MTALFQHYLPPAPAMLPYVSGRFYASQHARAVGGAVAMTANRLYCVPYVLGRPGLFSAMAVSVTTGAAGVLRMALAADNGAGRPGAVIEEPVADADTSAAGNALCPPLAKLASQRKTLRSFTPYAAATLCTVCPSRTALTACCRMTCKV